MARLRNFSIKFGQGGRAVNGLSEVHRFGVEVYFFRKNERGDNCSDTGETER